jgi:repressor LexA
MSDFNKLSERQRNILIFMDNYIADNSFPPTIREIGAATGINSTSVVNYNLNKLVRHGFMEREESKSRGLRLIRDLPGGRRSKVHPSANIFRVPHYGPIVAGAPINVPDDLIPNDDDAVEILASVISGINPSEVFALTVNGDSMIDAMIQDGDVVILRKTQVPQNGEMVAVWLTDRSEITLKHYYQEKDQIRLQPAHPTMPAIYVNPKDCMVQGKVLSVMRTMR